MHPSLYTHVHTPDLLYHLFFYIHTHLSACSTTWMFFNIHTFPLSFFCFFISLIHTYVYWNIYAHLPLPYSCTSIVIFMCMYILLVLYLLLATCILNIPIIIRFYASVSRRLMYTLCDPMFKGLYFNIHSYLYFISIYTHPMFIQMYWISIWNSPSYLCVVQHRLYLHPFHPHKYLFTRVCFHQDCSKHNDDDCFYYYKK